MTSRHCSLFVRPTAFNFHFRFREILHSVQNDKVWIQTHKGRRHDDPPTADRFLCLRPRLSKRSFPRDCSLIVQGDARDPSLIVQGDGR